MKKILLFLTILYLGFFSNLSKAQTLDSVITTVPIVCYGDFAQVTAYMTQTNPATPVKLMNYRYATATFLIGYGNSGVGTGLTQPFNNMIATNYRMLMVDSVAFWNAFPNGNPTSAQILSASNSSILDYIDYTVLGVPELSVVTNQTIDNLCNGDCDAAEQITILGGTPPYQILMDGQLSTLSLNSLDTTYINLCEGTYSLTVSDINGCSMSPSSPTSFSIAAPPPLSPNGSISSNYNGQDISCAGASDGIIVGAVAGGTPPYQYSIDGGANWSGSAVFSNLSAGTYTITYQDANLCETTESFTLNDPPLLSGAITINQQVSCNAACDGEIEFIVNNVNTGTPGYSFSIDNGSTFQNSPVFSNVCGDQNHTIIVQDANGCQATANIFIGQPTAISFSATSSSFNGFGVSCNGANDGEIIIFSPSGGVPNYDYSIDGGATFSNSMIYSNLGAGSYLVTVRDNNGCIKDTLITLNEPGPFTVSSSVTNPISCPGLCDGGITALQSNGVSPITYNLTTFPSQTFNVWSGLCGDITYGSYTLDATDANGCFATTTVTLIEPLPFAYTVDSIQETCNSSNGQASINVNQGGTAPYAYLWDDPFPQQITATATGLTTGTYTVVVTDANGCNFTEDIFVGEADIELSFDSVPPCNGGNDGSATVIPDGIPPYVITWETGETTTTINNLSPGFYTVTVTDNTGCIATDSVEVPASAVVDVVLDVQNSNLVVPCFGDPSSGVSVIATGGTGPNTYLYYIPNVFPTPQASSTFSGLYAGTYQIYAIDANGCFDSVEVTITQPTELIYTVSSTDVSCNGGSDGTAFIDTIYGGNPNYVYLWSNGQTTNTISSLFAGSYTVTVTDANGCSSIPSTATVIVDEPDALQSNISILNNSNCAGSQALATGEMEVTVTGGTTGYNYSWSTGSTNPNIGFLLPGTYTVTITDANNCSITDSAEILPGENPTLDVTIENVTCFGDNDGMIYTSAIGGTPTYSFSADGGITFVPSGTPFGPTGGASYFITVVDALGCTDSDSIFVFEPDLLTITSFSNQSISCYDSLDGEISVIHSGGTAPYIYLWDNGQTTNPAVDLGPGNYNVTVTDTNGCTTSLSTTLIQPDSLEITSIISGDVSCYGGSDGSMQVSLTGGTPNYNYNWSNGATTSIVSNVSSGAYSVTVFDQNGCTNTANIDVVQPADITVNYVRDSVSCLGGSNGSAIALVSGGVPGYTYLWENGNTSNTIINLSPGYYNLTIIDSNACIKQDSVEILGPTTSIAIDSMIVHPITCHDANNGSITILATGGQQPYTYSNTNGFNSQSTISFINLSPDTYIVYVEDAKGCWDRDTVVITNPDSLYIDSTIHTNVKCNGYQDAEILAINAFGGIPPYEYAVNGGTHYTNMAYFNGYGPGTYTVEVFDANNCAAQDLIIIEEPDEINLSITTSLWNSYEVRCNGDSSGYADLVISGGQAPYLKVVLDSQLDTVLTTYNNNITGLYADTYTFHVWDNNGCPKEEVIIYNEPTPIVHNFIANHITCDGWSNGSLVDSVYGGVGNASTYQYAWNTGDSTYIITSIPVGTYVMTIIDENNCISIDSFAINDNNILQANLDISTTNNVSCYNYCDATIGVLASGGAPNINSFGNPVYSYSWNDTLLQSTATAIGLCVDNNTDSSTYMCVVFDGQGCSDTLEYIVTQPDSLNVIAEIVSDVLCFGDNNGKLTASISPAGGTAPFTYLWNNETNFDSNPANNNLYSGSYVVVAKDANGCMDTTEIYLSQPSEINVDILSKKDVSCFGFDDGQITAEASGGMPFGGIPPKYSYTWSNSFNEQVSVSTVNSLAPGIYSVTVQDMNGCTVISQTQVVTGPSAALIMSSIDSTDETCNSDGLATAYVLGGTPPFTYLWNDGQTVNPAIATIPNSTYSVLVTDKNGCTVSDSTFVNGFMNVFLPGNLTSLNLDACLGDTTYINTVNDPAYEYIWTYNNREDTIRPGQHSNYPSISVSPILPIEIYELTIVDGSCSQTTQVQVNVSSVDAMPWSDPSPENGGFVRVTKNENVTLYSNNNECTYYEWSYQGSVWNTQSIDISTEESGWYNLRVDSAGCLGFDSIYVLVTVKPFDVITPNNPPDGVNDTWTIVDIESYPNAIVQIFNRWGAMVFETTGGNNYISWNGTSSNGNELPVGTYYYIIDLKTGDDPLSGPITIIR